MAAQHARSQVMNAGAWQVQKPSRRRKTSKVLMSYLTFEPETYRTAVLDSMSCAKAARSLRVGEQPEADGQKDRKAQKMGLPAVHRDRLGQRT